MQVKALEREHDILIQPLWMPRENNLIKFADKGSKMDSTDEWKFDDSDFNHLTKLFKVKPMVDLMASDKNTRCVRFFSRIPCIGAEAVDFFLQPLKEHCSYYICPPPRLVCKVLDRIRSFKQIKVILCVPRWPSEPYWCMLKDISGFKKDITHNYFFHTHFYSEANNSLFKGRRNFQMAAFLVNTHE